MTRTVPDAATAAGSNAVTSGCRACGRVVEPVLDLGPQPVQDRYVSAEDDVPDLLPLVFGVCTSCGLAQLVGLSPPEIDAPGAPSPLTSTTMAAHARRLVDELFAAGLARSTSRILSLASHGGHIAELLAERGVRATIVEPVSGRAGPFAAMGHRIVATPFDGSADGGLDGLVGRTDLVVDFYLLAHLADPRSALARAARLLAPGGALVIEFDHLLATVRGSQWDSLRHGHQTYLSVRWVASAAATVGLRAVDATTQDVYGGAVRVVLRQAGNPSPRLLDLLEEERAAGIGSAIGLRGLGLAVDLARRDVVAHLRTARANGRRVAGYGAPSRGTTFLNALDIGPELLPYVVDRAVVKQGRYVPGTRIPIRPPEALLAEGVDEVLILTWNLVPEVRGTLQPLVERGARLLVAMPGLTDVTEDGPGNPPRQHERRTA